jgi:hypothetical protein
MYLIFKRVNPYGVIAFDTLDDIKEHTKTEVYGKYNHDESPNDYSDFKLISNPEFSYTLCDGHYKYVENVILDVSMNTSTEYYLLDEHQYAHGIWDHPSEDGKKIIFDNLKSMKKYCKSVKDNLCYMYDINNEDSNSDDKLIDEKFDELPNYDKIYNFYPSFSYTDMFNYCLKHYFKTYNNISLEKFKIIQNYQKNCLNFEIGNDLIVNFTILKIMNNSYFK